MGEITTRTNFGEEKINILVFDMTRSLNLNEKSVIFFGEVERSDIWNMFDGCSTFQIGKTITPESDIIKEVNDYKTIFYANYKNASEEIKAAVPDEYRSYDYIIGVAKVEYHGKIIDGIGYDND